MKKVWENVKRISGKSQPSTIRHLVVHDNEIEHPKDIANTLASTISFKSSHKHYRKSFEKSRVQLEKRPLSFYSDYSSRCQNCRMRFVSAMTPPSDLTKYTTKC
jgi:hypothetical protein